MVGAEGVVRRHRQGDRAVDPRELLDQADVLADREGRAAELLGDEAAQESEGPELVEELPRKRLSLVPFHDVGTDLALGELAHALTNGAFFFGQVEVHRPVLFP